MVGEGERGLGGWVQRICCPPLYTFSKMIGGLPLPHTPMLTYSLFSRSKFALSSLLVLLMVYL